jgi:ankyrin repeat protein
MKTQKSLSKKVKTAAIMGLSILTLVSCGSSTKDSEKVEVKAPDTDIHTATFLGDLKSVQQHIKAGSDLDAIEPSMGSTALISASVFGKADIAVALIEAGANLNIQNKEGSSALHSATFLCRTEIVKMLLAFNADKTLKNIYGFTALDGVSGTWGEVKPIYDEFGKALGPLGLKLDYEQLEETRPLIADMLR